MWISTLELKLNRVLFTRLLGLVYPNIYYSSLSPLRIANVPRPTLPAANWVRVRNRLAGICGVTYLLSMLMLISEPRLQRFPVAS
jgi:hypothetical protein